MKHLIFSILLLICVIGSKAQYVSRIIEFVPAPGQFINKSPGLPANAESIIGGVNGLVSLGFYGGYLICDFEYPIENATNNPYGIDFTVFGNAYSGSSEPGIVMVMKDENKNGKADDIWYELKGSDHFLSTTTTNYAITYQNPKSHADVQWTDNIQGSGIVAVNDVHTQNYYPSEANFPAINQESYTLFGTRLQAKSYPGNMWVNYRFDYGYADNRAKKSGAELTVPDNPYTLNDTEGAGGDAFDISWAVDSTGKSVDLDQIDFIKIYNGVAQNAGAIGEVSTEIRGIVDVEENSSITGITDVLVSNHPSLKVSNPIKDEFIIKQGSSFQFETYVISKGKLNENQNLVWSSDAPEILTVDQNGKVNARLPGIANISVHWQNNSNIKRSFKIIVNKASAIKDIENEVVKIYPNPCQNQLQIQGISNASIEIIHLKESTVSHISNYKNGEKIQVSHMSAGVYLLRINQNEQTRVLRFVKY